MTRRLENRAKKRGEHEHTRTKLATDLGQLLDGRSGLILDNLKHVVCDCVLVSSIDSQISVVRVSVSDFETVFFLSKRNLVASLKINK